MKKLKINYQWQFGDMKNAGKTLKWYGADSEERFEQLLKRDIGKEWKDVANKLLKQLKEILH